ncbi:MAG: hypothetical protein ACRD1H_21260, partial [Vicinamibacterales bacterium]
ANTVFQPYSTRLHDPLRIGVVSASGVPAMVSDLAPWLNIGAGFLADYLLAFDQRSRLVALCPSGTTDAPLRPPASGTTPHEN